jgi:hypothetical protein
MFAVTLIAAVLAAGDVIFRFLSGQDLELKEALIVLVLGVVAGLLVRLGSTLSRLDASSKDISTKVASIAQSKASDTLVLALTDRSEQYKQGAEVLRDPCGPIFLMQRSSSLILGWEEGSKAEEEFYKKLMDRIKESEFYPVVSLEGIKTHLGLQGDRDRFTHKKEAFAHLRKDKEGNIYVQGEEAARVHPLKAFDSDDYKQGRILLVDQREEHARYADAIIVFDVGTRQFSLHLRGADLKDYLKECKLFYEKVCGPLTVKELIEKVPELRDLRIQPL